MMNPNTRSPRNSWLALTLILAALAAGGIVSHGAVITVRPGGGGDYTTIAAAVDVARDGDVIQVASGTYSESINLSTMNLIGDIAFQAIDGAGTVTLNGAGPKIYHAGVFGGALSIDGFIITSTNDDGVRLTSYTDCYVLNCVLRNVYAKGLNLGSDLNGAVVVYNTDFELVRGWGAMVTTGGTAVKSLLVQAGDFTGSGAVDASIGGVQFLASGQSNVSASVRNCTFQNLSAQAVRGESDSTARLEAVADLLTIQGLQYTESAIVFAAQGTSTQELSITQNTIQACASASGITVRQLLGNTTVDASITDNIVSNLGGGALNRSLFIDAAPGAGQVCTGRYRIEDNAVNTVGGDGLRIRVLDGADLEATVSYNSLLNCDTSNTGRTGFAAEVGKKTGSAATLTLRLVGNTGDAQNFRLEHDDVANSGDFFLVGDTAQTAQWNVNNLNSLPGAALVVGTVTVIGTPILPPVVNHPPTANPDSFGTLEDIAVGCNVLANDTDPDGDPRQLASFSLISAAGGLLSRDTQGTPGDLYDDRVVYQPPPDYYGSDSYFYLVSDGRGGLHVALVSLSVTPVNDAPTLNSLADLNLAEEAPTQTVPLSGIGTGAANEAQALTVTATSDNPSLVPDPVVTYTSPQAGGSLQFTPQPDRFGSAVITVTVRDDGGTANGGVDTRTRTFTVTVSPVNDPPTLAQPADLNLLEDAGLQSVPLTGIGTGSPNETQTLTVTATTDNATLITGLTVDYTDPAATGTLYFSPGANLSGTATIAIEVQDDGGTAGGGQDTVTRSFTVNVAPVNDAPVVGDDTAVTDEDAPVVVLVLSNDSDVDGALVPGTVTVSGGPAHGSVAVNPATGAITYTPAGGYSGPDSFTYQVCDDGTPLPALCGTATVNVTVNAVNDPPVVTDDTAVTDEDTAVMVPVLSNDSDVDGALVPGTVAVTGGPAHGSVVVDPATGAITYTPAANYSGPDAFTYEVCDDGTPLPAQCGTATVNVTVNAANDPPSAGDDTAATDEDTAVVVPVLSNDSDVDGALVPGTVTVTGGPAHGSVVVNPATGAITYTPAGGYNGPDAFTYQVCDDGTPLPPACSTATVNVTVNAVNDPPTVQNDLAATDEDVAVVIPVLANDSDVDGALVPGTVAVTSGPAHGSVAVNPATGAITYTPAPDYSGPDAFTYQVCDDGTPLPAQCGTAMVGVTVNAVNDPPIVGDDTAVTDEDVAVVIPVLSNDSDTDGSLVPGTVAVTGGPAHGSVAVNPATGAITYTPAPDYGGPDSFTYQVCDDGSPLPSACSTGTVNITVNAVNDAPVVQNDLAVTDEDVAVVIPVLSNDSDVDGALVPGTVTVTGGPANGTVTVNPATGAITYTPTANISGPDAFTYQVCDDGSPLPALCGSATVNVTVNAVNDPPVVGDDTAVTDEDTAVVVPVLANDSDADGALVPGSVTVAGGPAHGSAVVNPATGAITYTPASNYNGPDSFTYQVCDDGSPLPSACSTGTVNVTVNAVNDPPVVGNDTAVTDEDTATVVAVLANDSDVDGTLVPGTVAVTVVPQHGTAEVNPATGAITYTPAANYNGPDTFTYQACDDGFPLPSLCGTATVNVTVNAVNDPPVVGDDSAVTDEDTAVVVPVLSNDSDVDGGLVPGSVTVTGGPAHGSAVVNPVTGAITYTPASDYNGSDSFTYQVCDDGSPLPSACSTGTVNVTVNAVNDPPAAVDDTAVTDEDVAVVVQVLSNDSDVDGSLVPGSVTVTGGPAHGSVTVDPATGAVTYTPAGGYYGPDSFTYQVCDNGSPMPSACSTGTVSVTVNSVNDPPVAGDDTVTTDEDVPILIPVLANDTDTDGDPLSIIAVDPPAHGQATLDGTSIFYNPDANYNGADTFGYTVSDGQGGTDTAVVSVTVRPVNDPPVLLNDHYEMDENGVLDVDATAGVLANDTDADGETLTATLYKGPSHGTLVLAADGGFQYQPKVGYSGGDSFTYQVTDAGDVTLRARAFINILPVDDPPIIQDLQLETREDSPLEGCLPAEDPEQQPLLFELSSPPLLGDVELVDAATGEFRYQPRPFASGTDSFTWRVSDGENLSKEATVTVEIIPFAYRYYDAHLASSPVWWSEITIANLGAAPTVVYLHLFDAGGAFVDELVPELLAPMQSIQIDAASFMLHKAAAEDVWLRVGSDEPISGLVAFGTRDGGTATTLPLFGSGAESLIFPYVSLTDSWYTGLTLLNPGARTASVCLNAFAEEGAYLGQTCFTLGSRDKYARLIDNLFPGVDPGRIRFVQADATEPLIGFELFGSFLSAGLAGMPAVAAGGQDLTRQAEFHAGEDEAGSPDLPPSIPVGLQGWGRSGTEICLTWTANPAVEAVVAYEVFVKVGLFTRLVGSTPHQYITATGLMPEGNYRFYIRAVNGHGQRSGNSEWATARTLAAGQVEACFRLTYPAMTDPAEYLHGFTVSPLTGASTPLKLQLYDESGRWLWEQALVLADHAQYTRLLSGEVPAPVLQAAAYLRASSDLPLMGFQLSYNSLEAGSLLRFDGLPAAPRGMTRSVLPVVRGTPGWTNELFLTNQSGSSNPVTVLAWGRAGEPLGTWAVTLAAGTQAHKSLAGLFPGQSDQIGLLEIRSTGAVLPSLVSESADGSRLMTYPGQVVHGEQPE